MESSGIYDDSLLIVVADHGISFQSNLEHWRRIRPETVGDIAAVPLFVKAPGQPGGTIDDRRALTIDILPTIADVLGFAPPWETEGVSLFGADPRRKETTTIGPSTSATFGVDGREKLAMAERNAAWFPTGDPWELSPPGAADLRGERVEDIANGQARFGMRLDRAFWYSNVDLNTGIVPVRVSGELLEAGGGPRLLAVAVNGVVGAMTRSYVVEGETLFQALVPPEYFQSGRNTISLLSVEDGVSVVPRR